MQHQFDQEYESDHVGDGGPDTHFGEGVALVHLVGLNPVSNTHGRGDCGKSRAMCMAGVAKKSCI